MLPPDSGDRKSVSPTSEVRRVGPYRTRFSLGNRGFGEEFAAAKVEPGQLAASLRLLVLTVASAQKKLLKRRLDEARRLAHPHLESVRDVIELRGSLVVVTERVPGVMLEELFRRFPDALDPPTVAELIAQVASGLRALHDHADRRERPLEWVHGHLSPRTIVLSFDGRAVLSNVGLGPLVSAKNDFEYFSPEQARSGPVDRRSDLFALGLVLYEGLTGSRPFSHRSLPDYMLSVLADRPKDPCELRAGIPPELAQIAMRCLERDPDQRFGDAGALADALRACPGVATAASEQRLSSFLSEHFAQERNAEAELAESAESAEVSRERSPPAPERGKWGIRPLHLLLILAIALLIWAWAGVSRGASTC